MRASLNRSALFFVLLAACGGSPEPAATPSTAASAAPAETAPKPAEPPKEPAPAPEPPKPREAKPPTVKLLEPGAAPRRALRYAFKAGTTEWANVDMKMAMSMTMADKELPKMELPTMRMTMRIDAKEVTPEGDAKLSFDTVKVELLKDGKANPQLVSTLETELAGLVGLKGHSIVSPRGVPRDTDFELPPNASPKLQGQLESMRDAVRNIYMPLPEEEVGKGAKWQVTSGVPFSGTIMDMAATYTLDALSADSAQARVETVLSGEPNQPLDLTGTPNVKATLDELKGKGTGKVSPSFTKLVGTGTSNVEMLVASSATMGGDKITSRVTTNIGITIKPTKAVAPAKTPASSPAQPAAKK